jgi:hypothetical protein
LIDSYAEGLIDKYEFAPRITRLRQRLARLEEQRQPLADEAASQAELQLIIGRLEDFATKVHQSLEDADWASQRDLIRTRAIQFSERDCKASLKRVKGFCSTWGLALPARPHDPKPWHESRRA